MKIFAKKQKKEFECRHYYFCLISEISQRIYVTVKFGELMSGLARIVIPSSPRKKKKFASIDSLKIPQLEEQISIIYIKNN